MNKTMLTLMIAMSLSASQAQTPEDIKRACSNYSVALFDSDLLKTNLTYDVGGKFLQIIRNERKTAADDWVQTTGLFTTSFEVTAVASRSGGEEIYVVGVGVSNKDIVEKWTFTIPSGQWKVQSTVIAPPPVGTPQSQFAPTVTTVVQGGGAFAPPTQKRITDPSRTLLYRSAGAAQVFRYASADPEGRSLLLLSHTQKALVTASLQAPTFTPTVLFTTQDIPHLATATSADLVDHIDDGRVCLLTNGATPVITGLLEFTVIKDLQNDGVFDSHSTIDAATYMTNPTYTTASQWVNFWFK